MHQNEPTDYAALKQQNIDLKRKLAGYQNCFDLLDRLELGKGLTDDQLYILKDLAGKARAPYAPQSFAMSSENLALVEFTDSMRDKLIEAARKGRHGWNDPISFPAKSCAALLMQAVIDGDTVSTANYAMFLHQRGQDRTPEMAAQVNAYAERLRDTYIAHLKSILLGFCREHCEGDVPNCEEDVFQSDRFIIGGHSFMASVFQHFDLYPAGDGEEA